MKTAEQWQEELAGETSLESIRAIQADALTHAAQTITINADSPERGFRKILEAINALTPNTKLSGGGPLSNKTTEAESRRPLE